MRHLLSWLRGLTLLLAVSCSALGAAADSFYLSPDVPTDAGAGTWLPWEVVRNDSGTYLTGSTFPDGASIDGLHRMDGGDWLLSVASPNPLTSVQAVAPRARAVRAASELSRTRAVWVSRTHRPSARPCMSAASTTPVPSGPRS